MVKHYQQITVLKYKFSGLNYFVSRWHQDDSLLHRRKKMHTYIFMLEG
jgi:hypothetical protein